MLVDLRDELGRQHLGGRPVGDDSSPAERCDAVGVGGREVEVVHDDDHGASGARVAAHEVEHHLLVLEVHGRGRFVEEHDRGSLREDAGERGPGALAARERRVVAVGEAVDVGAAHRARRDEVVAITLADLLPRRAPHVDELFDREREGDVDLLQEHSAAHGELGVRPGVAREAVDLDGAAARIHVGRDDVDERRLPCAVRTDEGEHLSGADVEVESLEHGALAEVDAHATHGQDHLARGGRPRLADGVPEDGADHDHAPPFARLRRIR